MIKGQENLLYKGRLKKLGVFNMEKKKIGEGRRRDSSHYSHTKRASTKSPRFTRSHKWRTRGYWNRLHHEKFHVDIKDFFLQ